MLPAVLFGICYLFYFSQTSNTEKNVLHTVSITSVDPVNAHLRPDRKAPVTGSVVSGVDYSFLDSSAGWVKLKLADSSAFVMARFLHFDSAVTMGPIHTYMETDKKDAISVMAIGVNFFSWLLWGFHKQDKNRLLIEINYEMDDKVAPLHDKFIKHFMEAAQSEKMWQYLDARTTGDFKRNAGAGTLVNRARVSGIDADKKPSRFFLTNIKVPNLRLRNTDLYFFPERLVVKRGSEFAAIFYKHLSINSQPSRFIEESSVPSDAEIVDYTWKYVNKNGGPDKRFNNNRQLPICLYSNYTISSRTGVYEVISTSKYGAFDNFAHFVRAIGDFQTKL